MPGCLRNNRYNNYNCPNSNAVLGVSNLANNTVYIRPNSMCSSCNALRNCNVNECLTNKLCDALGCKCTCQFLTGNNGTIEERKGILDEAGNNYIVLRPCDSGSRLICNSCNLQFLEVKD